MGNWKCFSTVFFAILATLLICCHPSFSFANQTTVQRQPTLINNKKWSYYFEHPFHVDVPKSSSQHEVQIEENLSERQVDKQSILIVGGPIMNTPPPAVTTSISPFTPPPLPSCGYGPTMPYRSSISERVAGTDSSVASNPWPFLVNLKKSTDPVGVYFCSGSLISEQFVLLAAQCLAKMSMISISGITLWIGQSNENGPSVAQMTRKISHFAIHNGYNSLNYANDIALIKMNSPVPFSRSVGPVCLPEASDNPDQHANSLAAIMGWGPETQGDESNELRQGKVKIDTMSSCMSTPSFYSQYLSPSRHICVRTLSNDDPGQKFTCKADIGGPVVIDTRPYNYKDDTRQIRFPADQYTLPIVYPIWTQVGINSYTQNCASTGLKTRVSAFRTWIDQAISSSSG